MNKIFIYLIPLILIFGIIVFTGCAPIVKAPVVPPIGFYTDITSPYIGDHDKPIGSKCGNASCKSAVFSLFSWGDCSVGTAARNGDLEKVDYIGYGLTNILMLYTKWETKACGE